MNYKRLTLKMKIKYIDDLVECRPNFLYACACAKNDTFRVRIQIRNIRMNICPNIMLTIQHLNCGYNRRVLQNKSKQRNITKPIHKSTTFTSKTNRRHLRRLFCLLLLPRRQISVPAIRTSSEFSSFPPLREHPYEFDLSFSVHCPVFVGPTRSNRRT